MLHCCLDIGIVYVPPFVDLTCSHDVAGNVDKLNEAGVTFPLGNQSIIFKMMFKFTLYDILDIYLFYSFWSILFCNIIVCKPLMAHGSANAHKVCVMMMRINNQYFFELICSFCYHVLLCLILIDLCLISADEPGVLSFRPRGCPSSVCRSIVPQPQCSPLQVVCD